MVPDWGLRVGPDGGRGQMGAEDRARQERWPDGGQGWGQMGAGARWMAVE